MARKSKQVEAIAEWTGEARNRVYTLLGESQLDEAMKEIAKYPGLKMNDLTPVDKEAFARFSKALAEEPAKQEVLARNLFDDEQSVRRATRFLLGKLAVLDVRQLIPLMKELDESLVASLPESEAEYLKMMDEFFSEDDEDAELREQLIAKWRSEPWSIDRISKEFIAVATELIARAGVVPELEAAMAALHPKHLELWQLAGYRPPQATKTKTNAEKAPKKAKSKTAKATAPGTKANAKAVEGSKESVPVLEDLLRKGELAGLLGFLQEVQAPESVLTGTDESLRGKFAEKIMATGALRDEFFEALLSSDDALRGAALALMNSIPRFPFEQFLQRLYREIDARVHEYTDADRDRFKEVAVASAKAHGTGAALTTVNEWALRVTRCWDWRNDVAAAIASRFSVGEVLQMFRNPDLAGLYSHQMLAPHCEADPDLSLLNFHFPLPAFDGDEVLRGKDIQRRSLWCGEVTSEVFGGRPDLPLDRHRDQLAETFSKNGVAAVRSRDWRFILDWAWSVYMGDGDFTRVEKELWPPLAKEAVAYCLDRKPDDKWFAALSLFMMGATGPDARLFEKRRAVLPAPGGTKVHDDQYHLLERFGEAPQQKEWWLSFFKLEWEHYLTDRRTRMKDGDSELYLHSYEERITPFLRHSIQFGGTEYDDAVRSVLEVMDGQTLLEKLTRTRIRGDYGLFTGAIRRVATDEDAEALLRYGKPIEESDHYHGLAWLLRERRPAVVREFLRRWQKPSRESLPGEYIQLKSVETFAAHGLFAEEVTQRIAASLEAKDEEEFNWAFDLAFAYPEMMTAQGVDVLDLVASRIHRPAKRQIVSDTIRRMMLLGRYGRAPKDRVFAALEEAFQLDDPALWKKAAEGMREFRKEQPQLALSNPDRVKDLIERDPKKYAAIFKGLI